MYRRDRISQFKVDIPQRRSCAGWVGRAIKLAWLIALGGALTLAINILKEGVR
jgi:hypothetical protein